MYVWDTNQYITETYIFSNTEHKWVQCALGLLCHNSFCLNMEEDITEYVSAVIHWHQKLMENVQVEKLMLPKVNCVQLLGILLRFLVYQFSSFNNLHQFLV